MRHAALLMRIRPRDSGSCPVTVSDPVMPKTLIDQPDNERAGTVRRAGRNQNATWTIDANAGSTLIEFPGSRPVPAWRKQLSQRVREIQEQRAREAAESEAATRAAESVTCELPSGQLELVPDREQAPMNPIVSKALQRVQRARRGDTGNSDYSATATAPALALDEIAEPEPIETEEAKPKLTIVAAPALEIAAEESAPEETHPKPKPARLISDAVEHTALSYLDSCLHLSDSTDTAFPDPPSKMRRAFAAIIDLVFALLLVTPVAALIEMGNSNWQDPRTAAVMAGAVCVVFMLYETVIVALTGRTVGMRVCALRVMDLRTRMIPTGGQSLKRAVTFVFSLLLGGVGILFALIDRDGRTAHDRFSKTVVIND
jgi:uncharacterized RDD family membrane protein YckC